jgi:lipopolysaccharide export system protein LptC
MVTFKQISIGFLLAAALGLSSWSILLSNKATPTIASHTTSRPDAFMEDVTATIINSEGKPVLKVVAPKMTHYVENDATDMIKPSITVFHKESLNPWFINSNSAKAIQGINEITFQDHVVIHHPDKNNPTTIMRTNSLTVFPAEQVAQTKEPIIISQPASTIHATGMLANLGDGTVKLLSQAQEEYVPNS